MFDGTLDRMFDGMLACSIECSTPRSIECLIECSMQASKTKAAMLDKMYRVAAPNRICIDVADGMCGRMAEPPLG